MAKCGTLKKDNEDFYPVTDSSLVFYDKKNLYEALTEFKELIKQGCTDEQLQEAIQNKIDDGSLSGLSIEDGSITPQKTDFFKKVIVSSNDNYEKISNLIDNNDYYAIEGYRLTVISSEYNVIRSEQGDGYTTIFRKVKKGDIIKYYSSYGNFKYFILSKEIFDTVTAGYNSSWTIDGTQITNLAENTDFTKQIKTSQEINDILGNSGAWYYTYYTITIPCDGYLIPNDHKQIIIEYNQQITYGYTLLDTLENDVKVGGILKPILNGEINLIPKIPKLSNFNFSSFIDTININSQSELTLIYEKLSEPFGTLQYVGGICVNDKIYMAPNTSDKILVYDTINEYYYFISTGLGNGAFKYTGFVAWEGFIYAIPRGVNNLLKVNPITDQVMLIELDTNYPINPYNDYRDSHHYNGVISNQGYLYCPPAYVANKKLLKINMNDFTFEELDFTSENVSTWIGCVKHPTENKIIFLSTKVFRIWNCDDDTYEDIVSETKRDCYDMVYHPLYNCFIGVYPNHVFALNLEDNSIIDSEYINYLSTGYGVVLGVDGNIYHLEGQRAFRFYFNGTTFTQLDSITISENIGNTTPYLAGTVIDKNGNIYGVPASGSLTRLRFEGIQRKLSDYIVTSQYYGKY